MADKNYYEILGVSRDATPEHIKSEYRKLVKKYHPDLHPNDAVAAAKFKEINEANEVLSDPQKRKQYDFELDNPYASSFGGGASGDPFGGFGDIFSNIFGGFGSAAPSKRRGQDMTYELTLSFLDAALGCTKEFTYTRNDKCADCKGTGAKNATALKHCSKCGGTGYVKIASGSGFFRTVSTRICDDCYGKGHIILENCPTCKGKGITRSNTTVKFDIPAGADNGSYMKRKGYGDAPDSSGEPGDLLVFFKVKPHKLFTRKDFHIYVTVPISFKTACLGGKVKIPTLDDVIEYDVPEGTQSGKVVCLKGKGIKARSKIGDLFVTLRVETPSKLSRQQRQAISDIYDGLDRKQSPVMNTFKDQMGKEFGVDPYENN